MNSYQNLNLTAYADAHFGGEIVDNDQAKLYDELKAHYAPLFSEKVSDIYVSNKTTQRQRNYYCIHIKPSMIDFRQTTAGKTTKNHL